MANKMFDMGSGFPDNLQGGFMLIDNGDGFFTPFVRLVTPPLTYPSVAALLAFNPATDLILQPSPLGSEILLASGVVDLNSMDESPLFTVPANRELIVTRIVPRDASTDLDTAEITAGFNATFDDVVITPVALAALTGATLYQIIPAEDGAVKGVATDVFSVIPSTAQGAPATCVVDVFGYLIDVTP